MLMVVVHAIRQFLYANTKCSIHISTILIHCTIRNCCNSRSRSTLSNLTSSKSQLSYSI